MVEARNDKKCVVKHFAIDEEHVFAQYSLNLTDETYTALTQEDGAIVAPKKIGKNKVLFQALDISGSMAGAPTNALKVGALQIGQRFYDAETKPFQNFITLLYNHEVRAIEEEEKSDYEMHVNLIKAGGGTTFMNVFNYINKWLD